MNRKPLIYVSHPSSGLEENTRDIEKCIRAMYAKDEIYNNYCIVSPVHCYGFMYNDNPELDYDYKGLSYCTDLLLHCDIMLVIGDWEKSTGCKEEVALAKEKNIPTLFVKDSDSLIKQLRSEKNGLVDLLNKVK